jgi:hypothetical protein
MFPVMHVAHGVGFWSGLFHYFLNPDWSEQPETLPGAQADVIPIAPRVVA